MLCKRCKEEKDISQFRSLINTYKDGSKHTYQLKFCRICERKDHVNYMREYRKREPQFNGKDNKLYGGLTKEQLFELVNSNLDNSFNFRQNNSFVPPPSKKKSELQKEIEEYNKWKEDTFIPYKT